MANVFFIVEGQTEEQFYKNILQEYYLLEDGSYRHYFEVVVMPSKKNTYSRTNKGGAVSYNVTITNIHRFLDSTSHCDLILLIYDYYGLHESFKLHLAAERTLEEKVRSIQERLEADVNHPKFKFRLQVHEFEAFLFSSPELLTERFAHQSNKKAEIEQILQSVGNNPELINDHPETAPSKRLEKLFPGYGKISDGIPLAEKIGIHQIREKCNFFNSMCELIDVLSEN